MVNMMKYALAVIVSVTRADAEEQGGSVRVWSRVAKLLTPTLGKLCSRFYPAVSQRGTCLDNTLGVTFGRKEPEIFLALFHAAKEIQALATVFHLKQMVSPKELERSQKLGDTLFCPVEFRPDDTEKLEHGIWHIKLHQGFPLPDCGVYYADLGRAVASPEEEQAILTDPAGHALCMVIMETEGRGHGEL